ncbi:hypothetical protein [Agriterribacter humi]|uniref:hypothetical protein n=1 Tax=Agriterribacter humi TaxID=1104781 RepID=UPI00186AF63F|nr:hypothetical protein [Agriterribacter humi]
MQHRLVAAGAGSKKKEAALMIKWGKRAASMGKEKHRKDNATGDHILSRLG